MKLTGNNKGVKIGSFAARPPQGVQAKASMVAAVTGALAQPTDPDFNPEATFESSQGGVGDALSDEARKPKKESFAAFRSLLAKAKSQAPQQPQQQQPAQQAKAEQQKEGAQQAKQQRLDNPNEKSVQRRGADAAQAGAHTLRNDKDEKKKITRKSSSWTSAKTSGTSSFAAASNNAFEAEQPQGQQAQAQNQGAQESKEKKTTQGKAQGLNSGAQTSAGQAQEQAPTKTFKGAAFMKPGEGAEQVQRQNPTNPTDQKAQLRNAEAAKTSGSTAFTQSAKKASKGDVGSERNSNAFAEEGEEEGFVDTRNFLQMRNFYRSFSEVERRVAISNRGFNSGVSAWGEAARQVALSF